MAARCLPATRSSFALKPLVAACLLCMSLEAGAATYVVSNEAQFVAAINAVNASSGANFIEFTNDITLSGALPDITGTVTIKGNGKSLTGDGQHQLLYIGMDSGRRILVQVSDLSLFNGAANGEDAVAGSGEGGGLGAGGAVYVNSRADVVLNNVKVGNSTATGGDAAAGTGTASNGGYGEGGSSVGGSGGFAAGDGGTTGGGGGAGLGGAIFVADGGGMTVSGSTELGGNGVSAGSGAGDGGDGASAGSGIFLQGSGNLTLRVSGNQTMRMGDSISDGAGTGLGAVDDRWNLIVTGGGGIPLDSANPNAGKTYARVDIVGNNSFGGDLYVTGADIGITSTANLGSPGSMLALDDGGLYMAAGMTMDHDIVVNSGGARFGVSGGAVAVLSGDISGSGTLVKVGSGNIDLQGVTQATGTWLLMQGGLILDGDSHLGATKLDMNGGGVIFSSAFDDLRGFEVSGDGFINNGGFNVSLTNAITDWLNDSTLTFSGTGTTTITGSVVGTGKTVVESGRLAGNIATGELTVQSGATYDLNGDNHQVGALIGSGEVELGSNRLTIGLNADDNATPAGFAGEISGAGGLIIRRTVPVDPFDLGSYRVQSLAAGNTYGGGTRVEAGAIVAIEDDSSLGTGLLTLAGGGLTSNASSSALNITLSGFGVISTLADLDLDGVISGTGTLVKYGAGTLFLNVANSYVGNTVVMGEGSYVAVVDPDALGLGNLQLTQGGGLKVLTDTTSLRPIQILDGVGVVDVGSFDVQSTGGITGLATDSALRKEGTGRLLLTGTLDLPAGVDIAAGILQVGNGGSNGSISGDVSIADGAQLVINRSGSLSLAGDITGQGSVRVNGAGTVHFDPDTANTFLGGLFVENGLVAAASEMALGVGAVDLDNNGGLLLLGDIERDIGIGAAGARLAVDGANSFTLDGDLAGNGSLTKTGTGTLIATGVLSQAGGTLVQAGTLQVGSGMAGTLAGDVDVNNGATLIFGRDDLTLYTGVIDGEGTVIKQGAGELVLTGEQLFDGVFRVESGNLRIGLGGTEGSLSGDVELASNTNLIFDRSDDAVFNGGTSGAGRVRKSGPGVLTVTGDMVHAGGTLLNSGILQIGDGGTTGSISGDVSTTTGTQLLINRSDDVDIAANVSGTGVIVQSGTGSTTLTGNNLHTGGVIIENGHLAIDSDVRLGSALGKLTIRNGGILTFLDDFSLRDIRLEPSGGGLDTNGLDIYYSSLITGSGNFLKEGAGQLTMTRILVEGDLEVRAGDLRLGDGSDDASGAATLGNADIASGAELSLNRNGLVNFEGSLTGDGNFRQVGAAELRLPGDSSSFNGTTSIDNGSLRLDGTLGGDLNLASGVSLQGNGSVLGDVVSTGATITPGNSIGTLTLGSLTLDANSILEIELDAAGNNDKLAITGAASLSGTLNLLPLAGDYTGVGCCTYTIINAGSVSGTFSTVNNDLVFLNTSVTYLPTQVDVSFVRNNTGFNTVSLTYNQQQVSAAIDVMEAADPADLIAAQIALMSADQAREAFDVLSGDSLLSAVNASARSARRFSHMLSARSSRLGLASRGGSTEPMEKSLSAVRSGKMPQAPAAFANSLDPMHYDGPTSTVEGLWLDASYFKLNEDTDDTVGSASSTFNGQMLALGVDGYWTDNLIVGFGAGYLQGDLGIDNRKSEGDATGMFAGAYSRWETNSGWHYKGALTLGKQDTDQTRNGVVGVYTGTASSSSSVMSVGAELEAGIALHLGNYGLRPYAVMDVQYLSRDAFTETGAGPANLTVAAATDVAGEFGVGAEISRPWLTSGARWAQIQAGLALLQPFGDTQRQQTVNFSGASNSFTVKATPDDSAALQLTLGAEWYLTHALAVWGGYEGRVSSATQEHNAVLSFQYRW